MAMIFDSEGNVVSEARLPHKLIYEQAGWVSQNAKEILHTVILTGQKAILLAGISSKDILSVGITNQRETVVAWDKITGEPLEYAIGWQCKRSASIVEEFVRDGMEETIRQKTGLVMDSYFSASKMIWLLRNSKPVQEALADDRLYMGTIDSFLTHQLTGEFITDHTNASRTMLYNLHTKKWDEELLTYYKIAPNVLPTIKNTGLSVSEAPKIKESFFGQRLPITSIIGDQQAALFGQTCFEDGDTKATFGTGCFILQNIGEQPIIAKEPVLSTVAWAMNDTFTYALEASLFSAGSAIEWLLELGLISDFTQLEQVLEKTNSSDGVYFVPAFNGLGVPYWDDNARASFQGITLGTKKEELIKAVCDSIAYQVKEALSYMQEESGKKLGALMVDGGMSNNKAMMQFQADILQLHVTQPAIRETTCLGAAYISGLQSGLYQNLACIKNNHKTDACFSPQAIPDMLDWQYWQKAVNKSKNWL